MTSMRSIAVSGMPAQFTVVCSFSLMRTPSSSTSVFWSPKMPNPRTSTCTLGEPELSRVRMPGNWRSSSGTVLAVLFLMSSAVMIDTFTGLSR